MARTRLVKRPIGGWEVYDGEVHVGWVVKVDNNWRAFVTRPEWLRGQEVGWGFVTRGEAIDEVFIQRKI